MRLTLNYRPSARLPVLGAALSLTASAAFGQVAQTSTDVAAEVGALLDIAVGEYALAVNGSGIVDTLEYQETRLLLEGARELAESALLDGGVPGERLAAALDSAQARHERVASAAAMQEALEHARTALFEGWGTVALPLPDGPLSQRRGAALYRVNCANCHGARGEGDGPDAPSDPPPADFTDPTVILQSSPARLFQVTSFGIPGTEMEGWRSRLDEKERWDVVAYVGRLGFSDAQRADGERLWRETIGGTQAGLGDFGTLAGLSGADLLQRLRGSVRENSGVEPGRVEELAMLAHARTWLEAGGPAGDDPAMVATRVREELTRAIELHGAGDYSAARQAALQAYMTFEAMERELRARAPEVAAALESEFFGFRESLGDPDADLESGYARLDQALSGAVGRLEVRGTPWSDFLASLIIIVREGVEAILILGAVLAFLVRSGHADQRAAVYSGIVAALAASLLTALVVNMVFGLAAAQQEVIEGVTMLIAVVVLFSVSYWLVAKIEVRHWQSYIRGKMSDALSTGSQFALASVAFFAVYREGVETVLFYAALFSAAGSSASVVLGFTAGAVVLGLIYFLIYRFGMRIPLRPFFAFTSGILYLMAFVFAGKGIRELQEAGVVGMTPVGGVPRISLLGIQPTVEGLAVQGILVGALVVALAWTFLLAPARRRALAVE